MNMGNSQQITTAKSGMAIAGFVLGIIALLTSLVPIVNNLSFFLAILGIIFTIVGLIGIMKGKKSGKGLAIAAFGDLHRLLCRCPGIAECLQ